MEQFKPKHNRFKDAVWFPKTRTTMIVGGAGGISSWLSLLLTRAGFSPIVYDFDIVEAHNMGGQLYGTLHINLLKVSALKEIVESLTGEQIEIKVEKYTNSSMASKYMFSGFDNMLARKEMFLNWVRAYGKQEDAIFIDGRLSFEQLQIFCIKGGDEEAIKKYATEHLFDDSLVEDAPCTLRQTSHSAAMIASHMVGFFTNFLATSQGKYSSVPFFWEYFIPLDYLKTE